jgi:hypothetical protein
VPAFLFQEGRDRLVEQLPGHRTPDAWRLLSLRSRSRPSIGRALTCSRGLCYRRTDSTCRPAQCQRGQAHEPA